MTQFTQHPTVFLNKWDDALTLLRDAIDSFPKAQTITFVNGEVTEGNPPTKKLVEALQNEMVIAAQYLPLSKESQKLLPSNHQVMVIPSITSSLSVFKLQPLVNHLQAMSSELNGIASPTDISIYLNRLGFSSVAIATSNGDISIPEEKRNNLPREWDGYITHVNNDWINFEIPAAVHFDHLTQGRDTARILIDASDLPSTMNGTSRNVIAFLDYIETVLSKQRLQWDVTAVIPQDAVDSLSLKSDYISVVNSIDGVNGLFDLGISITPITDVHRCLAMNKLCLRWAVEHLDIIALRSLPFLSQQTQSRRAVELYLKYADEVFFISSSALKDAMTFFGLTKDTLAPHKTILMGAPHFSALEKTDMPDTSYFLVLGNNHPHKQVDLAINALIAAGLDVVSLNTGESTGPGHQTVSPGSLSDRELTQLIQRSTAVVFPSVYEGYGLPLAEAAALGKQVILWNSEVGNEVSKSLGTHSVNYFCESAQDISRAATEITQHTQEVPSGIRSLAEFNADLIASLKKLLSSPVNANRLNSRWELFRLLDAVAQQSKNETVAAISQQHWRNRIAKRLTKNVR